MKHLSEAVSGEYIIEYIGISMPIKYSNLFTQLLATTAVEMRPLPLIQSENSLHFCDRGDGCVLKNSGNTFLVFKSVTAEHPSAPSKNTLF